MRIEESKENMSLRNQKRGMKIEEGLEKKGNEGQGKRLKVQEAQKGLYNVQVGVASLEWPQVIQ